MSAQTEKAAMIIGVSKIIAYILFVISALKYLLN